MVLGAGGVDLGSAFGRIVISDNVDEAVGRAQRSFDNALQGIGGSMQRFGDSLSHVGGSLMVLTGPLVALGAVGLKTAADFDVIMKQIEVFGDVAPGELETVRQAALKFGADTKFSATDAANAMLDLLKSGQDMTQTLATMPAVLNLAGAGNINLAQSAGIVSTALAQFQMNVEESGRVADALAKAANASRADVSDLGLAMVNVGPTAAQFGLSIEDTAAALAVLSDNGIMGAEAGTQLRSMLTQLARPTKDNLEAFEKLGVSLYDNQGRVRNLGSILKDLKGALSGLSMQEQIELTQNLGGAYGSTALRALLAADGIDEMLAAMEEAPGAATVAAAFMDTFAGKAESLRGSIETLMITAMTPFMEEVLGPLTDRLVQVVNTISMWAAANPELVTQIISLVAAVAGLGTTALIAGKMIAAIGVILAALASPIGLAVAAIAGLAYLFTTHFDEIRLAAARVGFAVSGALEDIKTRAALVAATVQGWIDSINAFDLTGKLSTFGENLRTELQNALSGTSLTVDTSGVQGWIDKINALDLTGKFNTFATNVGSALSDAFAPGAVDLDMGKISAWAETNSNALLHTVVSVAGIVFGGPIGAVLGIANLIATAIENDFLGLGTFLEESGIAASVEGAFNDLKNSIEGIVESVFGGGPEAVSPGPMVESLVGGMGGGGRTGAALRRLGEDIARGLQYLKDTVLPNVIEPIVAGLGDLGVGLSGFFDAFKDTDWSGVVEILRVVGGAIGLFLTTLLQAGGILIGGILSGIGNALPTLGESISSFVNAISDLVAGDVGGALGNLADGLKSLIEVPVDLLVGFADAVLEALGLPGFKEDWDQFWGTDLPAAIDTFKIQIETAWTSVRTAIETAWETLKTTLETAWNTFWTVTLPNAINTFRTTIETAWNTFRTNVEAAWNTLKANVEGTWNTFWGTTLPNAVQGARDKIIAFINEILRKIQELVTGESFTQFISGSETFQSMLGRQHGGPVLAGLPYLVGEAGPELFVPRQSGTIVPNGALRDTYNISVVVPEAALLTPQLARQNGEMFGEALMEKLRSRGS